MWLCNVNTGKNNPAVNICVHQQLIQSVSAAAVPAEQPKLSFENAVAIPGLINSHDHLDFNLFPRLGNRTYSNYTEWGNDIHSQNKQEINAVLKIPLPLRSTWGIYKNLLAGVTTVVNHGPVLRCPSDIISVYQKPQSLHSPAFEKNWKYKLNNPLAVNKAVVIHAGEGTDAAAFNELNDLLRWNKLNRKIIAVHGVAMTAPQAKKLSALVWCPQTNFFLLNKTADINTLQQHTPILFGTDSTLTASWNIWEHLRLAQKTAQLSDAALWRSVNTAAANTWQLNCGELAAGKNADIVVLKQKATSSSFDMNPEDILLVMHQGAIRLFDACLLQQLPGTLQDGFYKITINSSEKYVFGNLPLLVRKILNYYPHAAFPFTVN